MAGIRRKVRAGDQDRDVRALLTAKVRSIAVDFREPLSGQVYRHPGHAWLAKLEAGEPVEVWRYMLRGIADVPADWRRVRVEADGTIGPADYARLTSEPR